MEYFKQPINSSRSRRLRLSKKTIIGSCIIAVLTAATATFLAVPAAKSTTSNAPIPPVSTSFPPFPTRDAMPPANSEEQPDGGVIIAPDDTEPSAVTPSPDMSPQQPLVQTAPSPDSPPQSKEPTGTKDFVSPVSGYTVTARYSQQGSWAAGHHTGIDLAVPVGTLVRSTNSGTVVAAGSDTRYGNYIMIRRGEKEYILYAHLSQISVQSGEIVAAAQKIGLSGATGNVTGPHLHFEVRTTPAYGSDIDPVAYLSEHGVDL